MDTDSTEFEPFAIAPPSADEWPGWFERVSKWRTQARNRVGYDDNQYRIAGSEWARSAFTCGLIMLWDEHFYDPVAGRFTVDEYLDAAEEDFGGFDVIILWHAYPRIGFDDRNQFDYYRDVPGGLEGLASVVAALHRRGVHAILDYNPWDASTRREPRSDEETLARMLETVHADGL